MRANGVRRVQYINMVPNRGSPPAILLRESIHNGERVQKRTIANMTALPIEQAEMIRRVLKGESSASWRARSRWCAHRGTATSRRCQQPCDAWAWRD